MDDGDSITVIAQLNEIQETMAETNQILKEINDRAEEMARIGMITRYGSVIAVLIFAYGFFGMN